MLTIIDVQFILDGARLGLFRSTNILQIADVALRVVLLPFLPCFTIETSEMFLFFVFTT